MDEKDPLDPRHLPKQKRSTETVRAILEAAAKVLEGVRLNESSTNQIAKIAGVSIGTLYQYFPNKESLASILIDRELKKNVEKFQQMCVEMKGKSAKDFLREFAKQMVDSFLTKRPFLRAIYEYVPQFSKIEPVIRARDTVIQAIAKEFEARQGELKPDEP